MTSVTHSRPSSLEQAIERLEQAHDSLLGLGNLSESLFNFTTLTRGDDPGATTDGQHAGTPWGVKASQGQRPNMEDAYSVQMPQHLSCPHPGTQPSPTLPQSPSQPDARPAHGETVSSPGVQEPIIAPPIPEDLAVLSVFDGHGGTEVAEHCRDRLHKHFAAALSHQRIAAASGRGQGAAGDSDASLPGIATCFSDSPTNLAALRSMERNSTGCTSEHVTDALRAAFHKTDTELAGTDAGEYVGATAVVAVVGRHHIWIAHCGDSRAVIQRGGEAVALTRDHKPDREDEAARIKTAGGRIVYTSGSHRVMGMLAMSRAIGDHFLRPYVIAEPEVSCVERTSQDEVLVLATDGLWDVFSCKEATTLAQRCITRSKERGMSRHGACRVAASVLTKVALERGSRDNITVIVVDVSIIPPSQQPATAAGTAASQLQPHHAAASSTGGAPGQSSGGAGGLFVAASGRSRTAHGAGAVDGDAGLTGSRGGSSATAGVGRPGPPPPGVEPCAHSVPASSISTSSSSGGVASEIGSTDTSSFGTSSKVHITAAAQGSASGTGAAAPVVAAGGLTATPPRPQQPQSGTLQTPVRGAGQADEQPQPKSGSDNKQPQQPQQRNDADNSGDQDGGAVAGGSAGSKAGGTGAGMGARTQSFSLTTCTWVKGGASLAGSLVQGGGSSSSLARAEGDRAMDRQISAPSRHAAFAAGGEQGAGESSTGRPPAAPFNPTGTASAPVGRMAHTEAAAAAAAESHLSAAGGPGSAAASSQHQQVHKSGQQSPRSPKNTPPIAHRLAHGSGGAPPQPSAVIRALQAEQQQRSLPPVAPGSGQLGSGGRPGGSAHVPTGGTDAADTTGTIAHAVATASVQSSGGNVRNGSENGAALSAVSAARRGRVAVKRPGSSESEKRKATLDSLQASGGTCGEALSGAAGPEDANAVVDGAVAVDGQQSQRRSAGGDGGAGGHATGRTEQVRDESDLDGSSRAFKTM